MDQTPIIRSDNMVQQTKDFGSKSFNRAINEVFRLLPEELCPKLTEENNPTKPLSDIKELECLRRLQKS